MLYRRLFISMVVPAVLVCCRTCSNSAAVGFLVVESPLSDEESWYPAHILETSLGNYVVVGKKCRNDLCCEKFLVEIDAHGGLLHRTIASAPLSPSWMRFAEVFPSGYRLYMSDQLADDFLWSKIDECGSVQKTARYSISKKVRWRDVATPSLGSQTVDGVYFDGDLTGLVSVSVGDAGNVVGGVEAQLMARRRAMKAGHWRDVSVFASVDEGGRTLTVNLANQNGEVVLQKDFLTDTRIVSIEFVDRDADGDITLVGRGGWTDGGSTWILRVGRGGSPKKFIVVPELEGFSLSAVQAGKNRGDIVLIGSVIADAPRNWDPAVAVVSNRDRISNTIACTVGKNTVVFDGIVSKDQTAVITGLLMREASNRRKPDMFVLNFGLRHAAANVTDTCRCRSFDLSLEKGSVTVRDSTATFKIGAIAVKRDTIHSGARPTDGAMDAGTDVKGTDECH